jgi:hypothetical protein
MYPWLREMYAVVQIGSTILRSECMTTLRVGCPTTGLVRPTRATTAARMKTESLLIDYSYSVTPARASMARTETANQVG